MGMRQVADYLNIRGIRTATGGRWGLGMVYELLTRTTYIGIHRFNVYSWRKKQLKPADEVVEVAVPAIIDTEEFETVQELMRSRSPQLKAPRFVNGPMLLGGIAFCADCGGAMTLRTSGKSEQYRYYTCCTKARQGETGCRGRSIPMDRLDSIVVEHIERRVLHPDRLVGLLSGVLERRKAQDATRLDRLAELKRQAAEADGKLTRLYEAIENGVADVSDPNLKGRLAELKAVRDAARADVERAEGRETYRSIEITPELLRSFAAAALREIRTEEGTYRRHHLQALAQRVEVGLDVVRIKGSKAKLLQTLAASGGGYGSETAVNRVRSFVPSWLPGPDSNQRPTG